MKRKMTYEAFPSRPFHPDTSRGAEKDRGPWRAVSNVERRAMGMNALKSSEPQRGDRSLLLGARRSERVEGARQIFNFRYEPTLLRYSTSYLSPLPRLQEILGLSLPTARFALRGPQSHGPERAYDGVGAFQ
jgi:hypothetical protein